MRGRDKKTKAYDKLRKDDVFEKRVDEAPRERFHRPAYQAGSMVRAQGQQMEEDEGAAVRKLIQNDYQEYGILDCLKKWGIDTERTLDGKTGSGNKSRCNGWI